MSEFDDGREVLCALSLPLPVTLVGALGQAIAAAANEVGYSDVVLLTDGSNRIVATPPGLDAGSWDEATTTRRERHTDNEENKR